MSVVGPVTDSDAAANQLAENAADNSTVGITVSATDADGDHVSYSTDDVRLDVDSSGTVRVTNGASFDFETESSILLTVTATSADGSMSSEGFSLAVTDVNEAPVVGVVQVHGTIDRTNYTATSDGYTVTGRRIEGSGALSSAHVSHITSGSSGLGIAGTTGASAPAVQLGYDAGRLISEQIVIDFDAAVGMATVDVNALWSNENSTSEVGNYVLFSNGAQVAAGSFASAPGQKGTTFTIDPGVDFDRIVFAASPYADQGSITTNSSDYYLASVAFSLANGVLETAAAGSVAAVLTAADPDTPDTVTFSLVDGVGNPATDPNFEIVGNEIRVKAGATLDRETAGSFDLTIRATDGNGLFDDRTVAVHVFDANEAPVGAVTDADAGADGLTEGAAAGDSIGIVASATDADATATVGYSTDDSRFDVDADGTVRVAAGASFDAETEPSISFSVTATSSDGSTSTRGFTLSVGDINEAPLLLSISDQAVVENDPGAIVGILTVTDPDAGDSHAFAVSDARFEVVGGVLRLKSGVALDHETEASVSVEVTATDSGGLDLMQSVVVTVEDEWEYATSLLHDRITGDGRDNLANGYAGNDVISGKGGGDTLMGNAGDDLLRGGSGADALFGGIGRDLLDYRFSDDGVEVDLKAGTALGGHAEGDSISGFESLRGSGFGDVLRGNGHDNMLVGLAGADHLDGRAGIDRADYRHSGQGVAVDLHHGSGTGGDAEGDTLRSIENIRGSLHDDQLVGNGRANVLFGSFGNDTLDGARGADRLFGGSGSDVLDGGAGNDVLWGGSGSNRFVFTGGRDVIQDFQDGVDLIEIHTALSMSELMDRGHIVGDHAKFVIDGDLLVIRGVADLQVLQDDLIIV